jgi:hypothetical protein
MRLKNLMLIFAFAFHNLGCISKPVPVHKLEKSNIKFMDRKARKLLRKNKIVFAYRFPIAESISIWHYNNDQRYLNLYSRKKKYSLMFLILI